MKKALIHFYGDAVIDCDSLAEGLSIVEKLIKVETKGYGRERKAIEAEDSTFDFELINDSQFIKRKDEVNMLSYLEEKVAELEKENSRQNNERYKAQNEASDVKKQLECLQKELDIYKSIKDVKELTEEE